MLFSLNTTKLHLAADNGDLNELKEIFSREPDIIKRIDQRDLHGNTALHFAVKKKNLEVVRFFLQKKATTWICNDEGNTPLHFAYAANHEEIINALLLYEQRFFGALSSTNVTNNKGLLPKQCRNMEGRVEVVAKCRFCCML
jgi:ankyrin repeat protein